MRIFSASERATGYDQELTARYQLEFFSDTFAPPKTQDKKPEEKAGTEKAEKDKPVEKPTGKQQQSKGRGKGKKATRKKRAKCPVAVIGQRHSALMHLHAIDQMLLLTLGVGLVYFQSLGMSDAELVLEMMQTQKLPPALVLHADAGSPGYAMDCFWDTVLI